MIWCCPHSFIVGLSVQLPNLVSPHSIRFMMIPNIIKLTIKIDIWKKVIKGKDYIQKCC